MQSVPQRGISKRQENTARIKSKPSGRKRQSAKPAKSGDTRQKSANPNPTAKSKPGPKTHKRRDRSFHFPEVAGKVLEDVEFTPAPDYNVITLSFRDNTCMDLVIDTCFTVKADLLDRGQGDHRVLKRWPLMHSERYS